MKLTRGIFTAALLATLTISGCVSIAPASDSVATTGPQATGESPAATRKPDTPWTVELRQVDADGKRTVDSARRLFALAYGALPGVDAGQEAGGPIEGTIARRAIMAHYDELTAAQQAAVDAEFTDDPDANVVNIGPATQSSVQGVVVADTAAQMADQLTPVQQAIADATRDYRAAIAAKIGDIPGDIKLSFPTKQRPETLADTDGIWVDGSFTGCSIRWFTAGLTDAALNILLTAAHETFHCFQAANINDKQRYYAAPDWYQEGGAEWVAYDVAGAPQDGGFWDDYVDDPETPLFERTYDGLGFFADLAATGIDPWSKWLTMWSAYDNEPAWLSSGAEDDTFLNSWASGWFRDPARGADWDMTGPGIPGGSTTPDPLTFGNGSNASYAAEPYANAQYAATSGADVFVISGTGHVRISDGSIDESQPIGQHFCTRQGGCACPDGKPPPFPVTDIAPNFDVAVTGGSSGASGAIAGMKLEDACKKPEESKAVTVQVDRPGSPGVLPGREIDLTSCDGPYGTWRASSEREV